MAQRQRWNNRMAFIMAAVGSAVGLGNLWRFPAIAFKNGGGAFFIPYFVALFTAGIPLMIVEYAIGQKFQGGAPQAMAAITKKFRWVGWFALLVGATITTYYVVIMAYAWHYSVASLTVAWSRPAPTYQVVVGDGEPLVVETPAAKVVLYVPARDEAQKERLAKIESRIPVWTDADVAVRAALEEQKPEAERRTYMPLKDNVANYFGEKCLGGFRTDYWKAAKQHADGRGPDGGGKSAVGEMFTLSPNLVLGALVTWLLIFLIIFRGVHNVGKVVMFTVPLPIILLLIVLVRGITLEGSTEGLIYYLKPNWEMLRNTDVWIAAYGQVFFSLSLGFGILIAYASYMPPESDVTNSAFITSLGNCATSFLAGMAVFSVLGYLAYVSGETVDKVVAGGPGLVFQTYPIALSKMPMGAVGIGILSFLFFICLISLGIDSAFSLVEGIVTGFCDRFTGVTHGAMSAIACVLGFMGSLFFCTRSGLMWLDIVDNWMNNYGLPLVGLLECIAVGYFFHLDELKDYINEHSEIKVHNWFDAFIKVVTPVILIYLLGQQFLKDIASTYGGYDGIMQHSVTVAGWGWFALMICLALLLAGNYRMVAAVAGTVVLFLLGLAYGHATSEVPLGELVAPAAMGAIAAALLFGGLIACIMLALRTRHMAGLSLEETKPEATEEEEGEPGAAE